jgi:uncharacterized protein
MAILINLRHLERKDVVLQGEASAEELDLGSLDELVKLDGPVGYDLVAEQMQEGILVQGEVRATLACECSRCLKPFKMALDLENWACHVALEGEEAATVKDDSVDLTPYLREDILLELPQRPLCKPDCGGLPPKAGGKTKKKTESKRDEQKASAWDELNKLKL